MTGRIFIDRGLVDTKFELLNNGSTLVTRSQDIQSILDDNKARRAAGDGYTPSRDMKHEAQIPLVIYEEWWKEHNKGRPRIDWCPLYGKEMTEVVRRKLNDPDNSFLRTSAGTL